MVKRVPVILVAIRAASGPGLILAEWCGASGRMLAAMVGLAFLSDVFDGILARRLGVASVALRRADSVVDAVFYVSASLALLRRAPVVLERNALGMVILVVLELSRALLERTRYGRVASYHMWSAKAWGICLWLGFSEAFLTGAPGPLFRTAVVAGILADLEGLSASVVLSRWHHDVPTVWHAVRIEQATGGTEGGTTR